MNKVYLPVMGRNPGCMYVEDGFGVKVAEIKIAENKSCEKSCSEK